MFPGGLGPLSVWGIILCSIAHSVQHQVPTTAWSPRTSHSQASSLQAHPTQGYHQPHQVERDLQAGVGCMANLRLEADGASGTTALGPLLDALRLGGRGQGRAG